MNATSVPAGRVSLSSLIDREERHRRKRRLVWLAVAGVIVGGIVALAAVLRPGPVPLPARFRSQPVTVGDLRREVRASGHVEAVSTVLVGAEISGRIAEVGVDYNDLVKAGQVLARFDRASLEAQQTQARASLEAAKAALEQAKTEVERAGRELARGDVLFAQRGISALEHDNAVSTAKLAAQRVLAARAQATAQEAAFAIARTNIDHAVIRSPIDGIIITRNIDPGQTVASLLQAPVLFSVAADLKQMRVVVSVDEADIGEVQAGQKVRFTVNAWPERTFEGRVTLVRNSPVITQDVVTYGTVVEVDNRELLLKPGMTAAARIQTAEATGVVRVPNAALHFTPPGMAPGERPGVWRLTGGQLTHVEVKTGVADNELTEASSEALAPGLAVLTDLTPEGRKAYGLAH